MGVIRGLTKLVGLRGADAALLVASLGAAVVVTQVTVGLLLPSSPSPGASRDQAVSVLGGQELEKGPAAGLALRLGGDVDGLAPGVVRPFPLTVNNGSSSVVTLVRFEVSVGDTTVDGCPPANLTVGTGAGVGVGIGWVDTEVVVGPGGTATIEVPLLLALDAPDACQDATFPLELWAHGIVP